MSMILTVQMFCLVPVVFFVCDGYCLSNEFLIEQQIRRTAASTVKPHQKCVHVSLPNKTLKSANTAVVQSLLSLFSKTSVYFCHHLLSK